jgi:phosphopentomutase
VQAAGSPVLAIGKIHDLFAGRGITESVHTHDDLDGMQATLRALETTRAGLIFTNLVDLDTVFGHRNDPRGYGQDLEQIDAAMRAVVARLESTDLVIITADHGNDPTTPSTDHSREFVPLLVAGPEVAGGIDLGIRPTFADVGATVAAAFGAAPPAAGTSFLEQVLAR